MFKHDDNIEPKLEDGNLLPSIGEMPVYAIGDIHGRRDCLDQLLENIEQDAGTKPYRLIFLGDYIDRGPDSWGVIERLVLLRRKKPSTIFLKGNHEQVLIDFLAVPEETESWLDWGGLEALKSYGVDNLRGKSLEQVRDEFADLLPDDHFRFLLDLELYHQRGDYIFVHAGLNPLQDLAQQKEQDLLWIRDPFLQNKSQRWGNKTIVHGHTPVENAQDKGWRINVDSGAYASGILSAVCLDGTTRRFITSQ